MNFQQIFQKVNKYKIFASFMVKILMVVAPEGYQDTEFNVPRETFENAGFDAVVASRNVSVAKGCLGGEVKIDIDASKANPEKYDAVVFVGGPGCPRLFDDDFVMQLARNCVKSCKIVAAICIAPVILARAGLLKGKKATVFPSGKDDLASAGARYTGAGVEIDGKFITANGPRQAQEFADAIVSELSK